METRTPDLLITKRQKLAIYLEFIAYFKKLTPIMLVKRQPILPPPTGVVGDWLAAGWLPWISICSEKGGKDAELPSILSVSTTPAAPSAASTAVGVPVIVWRPYTCTQLGRFILGRSCLGSRSRINRGWLRLRVRRRRLVRRCNVRLGNVCRRIRPCPRILHIASRNTLIFLAFQFFPFLIAVISLLFFRCRTCLQTTNNEYPRHKREHGSPGQCTPSLRSHGLTS